MIDLNDTSAGQVVKDRSKMKEAVKTQDRIREKTGDWNGKEEIRKWRKKYSNMNRFVSLVTDLNIGLYCSSMPQEVSKDPTEDFSTEDLEERLERDLEKFKENVDRAFSEQSD